jgi:hypothetical protein
MDVKDDFGQNSENFSILWQQKLPIGTNSNQPK